jgi:hypothetical protein
MKVERYDIAGALIPRTPYQTDCGILLCDGKFALDNVVLEYQTPNGIRREFRPAEENEKALTQFGCVSLTDEHPTFGLLSSQTGEQFRKGLTLENVTHVKQGKGGFVQGAVAVLDSRLQDLIFSGTKVELSPGYKCRTDETPGVFVDSEGIEHRYDAIQRDLEVNHMALTWAGRAGPEVAIQGLRRDSTAPAYAVGVQIRSDQQPVHQQGDVSMAKLPPINGVTYEAEIPDGVASAIAAQLNRLDSLLKDNDLLQRQLDEALDLASRQEERADSAEDQELRLQDFLQQEGYRSDSKGGYQKKGKSAPEGSDEEEMGESGEEEAAEDEGSEPDLEEMLNEASKGKQKKRKGKTMKKDSARDLLVALEEAESILPGSAKVCLDSELVNSPDDVRRVVVCAVKPYLKLDSKSQDVINSHYDDLLARINAEDDERDRFDAEYELEDEEDDDLDEDDDEDDDDDDDVESRQDSRVMGRRVVPRRDSIGHYAAELRQAVSGAGNQSNRRLSAQDESIQRRMGAHKTPLLVSRARSREI